MIRLVKLGSKWQKMAELGRSRRIAYSETDNENLNDDYSAPKGHFVIYTVDERRFMLPLDYLGNEIFQQLLKMSEDEFGLSGNGPIRMPCDADFMQYVVLLLQIGGVDKDVVKALVDSITSSQYNLESGF